MALNTYQRISSGNKADINGAPEGIFFALDTDEVYVYVGAGWVKQEPGNITITDGGNIAVGSSTGTQIGTSASQKIGFFGTTPAIQQAVTYNTALAAVTDANAKTCLTNLKTALANLGLCTFS